MDDLLDGIEEENLFSPRKGSQENILFLPINSYEQILEQGQADIPAIGLFTTSNSFFPYFYSHRYGYSFFGNG